MRGPARFPLGSETAMKQIQHRATSGRMYPQTLRRELQHDDSSEMQFRRAIVGTSLVGMASTGIVSLLQMGIVKHLPDPPTRPPHFHSDKVNSPTAASGSCMTAAPLPLDAHAATIMHAAAGTPPPHQDPP